MQYEVEENMSTLQGPLVVFLCMCDILSVASARQSSCLTLSTDPDLHSRSCL